jgi:hypothetical protein
LGLLALLLLSPWLAQGVPPTPAEFPLDPGTYWVYSGRVAWMAPGSATVQRRELTWRMEVREVIAREFATAAIITGHPRDLIWYQPDRQPQTSVVVRVSGGRHYLVGPERSAEVISRMKDAADSRAGLVRESEAFLVTPIALDQRICEAEFLTRADGMYCWWVDEERNPGPPIKAAPAVWDGLEYAMTYRAIGSTETVAFGRGVGITSYDFTHHGTTSDVQLRLVEVGRLVR